ncbi:MAG: AAA family ATPase [Clostridia bacterium]|nr:AAA family ATPase [Clostridia bacterium]
MIKKIYIEAFGGIKNKEIVFSEGLNIIYGENEAGKTTIQAFIKAMLYGMDSSRRADIRTNPRKRFMPCDGDVMSGSMQISHYMITRRFGKTPKGDRCSVIDIHTGEAAETENIGEMLLGIGSQTFSNTLAMESYSAQILSDDEIMTKLANLRQSAQEDVSYEKAREILKSEQKKLIGKNGISAMQDDIYGLEIMLKRARDEYLQNEMNKNTLADLRHEHGELLKKQAYFEEARKRAKQHEDYRTYTLLLNECEGLKEEISKLREKLHQGENLKEPAFDLKETEMLEKQYQEKCTVSTDTKQSSLYKNLSIVFLLLSLAGFFGIIYPPLFFLFFCIFPFVFLFSKHKCQERIHSENMAVIKERDALKHKLDEIYNSLGTGSYSEYARVYSDIKIKQAEKNSALSAIDAINKVLAQKQAILSSLEESVKEFSSELDKEDDEPMHQVSYIDHELSNIAGRLHEIEKQCIALENAIRSDITAPEGIYIQLSQKTYEKKQAEEKLFCINTAADVLEETFSYLQKNFVPDLNKKISQIFAGILGNQEISVSMSSDFHTAVIDKSRVIDGAYLSNGAIDAVYFSARMAIVQMMLGDKGSFLLLDDAFIQYDDKRAKRAMNYLCEIGKDNQVLYFTCQSRFLDAEGATFIEI